MLSFFPFIPHSILNSEVQKVVVRYVVGGRFRVKMISLFKQCVVSTNKRECGWRTDIYSFHLFCKISYENGACTLAKSSAAWSDELANLDMYVCICKFICFAGECLLFTNPSPDTIWRKPWQRCEDSEDSLTRRVTMGKKRWSVASIFSVLAKVPLVGDKVLSKVIKHSNQSFKCPECGRVSLIPMYGYTFFKKNRFSFLE